MKRRSPLVRKATLPSRVAKIVSSLPMPVPGPGRKRVPRCRTRIMPADTSWPAKSLTPSICGFESRPLRDEPSPFLCAMSVPLLGERGLERGDRDLLVALRGVRGAARCRLGLRLGGLRLGGLRLGGLRLRLLGGRGLLRADRLDLDLRQAAAVAVVLAVARPAAVLADAHLVAEHVADDAGRHRDRGRE